MSENKIRQRHEIPVEDTWKLEDLYVSDEAWEAELATIEEDKAAAASFAASAPISARVEYCFTSKEYFLSSMKLSLSLINRNKKKTFSLKKLII